MQNRLIIVLGIIICFSLFGCSGVNLILKDPTPSTVLWKGEWTSTKYKSVFGDITVRLPKDIPSKIEFKVPVAIGFNLKNSDRPGKTYSAYYKGRLQENIAQGAGNASQPVTFEDAKTLGLKPYPALFNFIEEFTLSFNKKMNQGSGSWKSSDGDYGIFSLTRIGV